MVASFYLSFIHLGGWAGNLPGVSPRACTWYVMVKRIEDRVEVVSRSIVRNPIMPFADFYPIFTLKMYMETVIYLPRISGP